MFLKLRYKIFDLLKISNLHHQVAFLARPLPLTSIPISFIKWKDTCTFWPFRTHTLPSAWISSAEIHPSLFQRRTHCQLFCDEEENWELLSWHSLCASLLFPLCVQGRLGCTAVPGGSSWSPICFPWKYNFDFVYMSSNNC